MRKTTILAALAAALTSTIGMAQGPDSVEQRTFVHDGHTYTYTTSAFGKSTVLKGRRLPGGETFRLQVRDGRVTGRSGETPVAFSVRDAKGAAGGVSTHAL